MRKFFIGFFLVLAVLGGAWYARFIYSYERWFDTHLVSTVWTVEKEKEVTAILDQPFSYFAKGSTSKAYVSADGQFVLKTFLEKKFVSSGAFSLPVR